MDTHINTIANEIERSILLSPERKEFLLGEMAHLDAEGLSALGDLMKKEPKIIAEACKRVIAHAVASGNADWLRTLDVYLRESTKKFRKAEEGATDSDDDAKLENFFEATA